MISSTLKIIGCLFAVCLMVHAQTPAQKTNTGTISGKVTHKGNGLPGIAVAARLSRSGNPRNALVGITDQLGNYRITNVAAGQYEVMTAAQQFVLGTQAPTKILIVGEGENLENVDFALIRGGVITGKITDADGRPMIEEPIELFAITGTEAKPQILMNLYAGLTDDRGIYRIFGLRPGKYRVAAGASEERMSWGRAGRAVYGQTFHPSTTEASEAKLVEVTEGGEATNVDITLRRMLNLVTVYARVIDGDTGKPVPNARYGLQKVREDGASSSTGFAANHLGEIRLENLPRGKYALFLDPSPGSGVYSEPVRFEVVDQDIKDLVIKTTSGSSISGVVVLDGLDPKLAVSKPGELTIFAQTESKDRYIHGSSPNATVNPDGSFSVGGLRPGVVHFSVWSRRGGVTFEITQIERDGVAAQPGGVEIKAGEQIKGLRLLLKARTGQIRGVVKVENGQVPFAYVNVTVRKMGDVGGLSMQTDDRGRFISEPMAAGVYEVVVSSYRPQGRYVSTKQQVVVSDNQVTEVTLTLDLKSDPGQGRP
ncbi:MAG TPA: carboxypeptidase regulatory-like domain-containing protein [Pyrinomonadaceae bacterium]|nr:carboxypeptidase regulatory-like domain-containing protein [Pyrinomonadaceae bacterium]